MAMWCWRAVTTVLFSGVVLGCTLVATDCLAALQQVTLDDKRKYLLYIPTSVKTPAPLVLMFHGGGGHMQQAAEAYGWQATADKYGFVLAFPNGASRWPRGHLATWNAGACCGYARDEQVDDMAFVRALLADLPRHVAIDKRRVFATGMSNGGMLTYRLACDMAEHFRAIASVAGTDNTLSCAPTRPLSVLHIHARDDTHVLYNGGAGPDAFRDMSKVTDFTSVAVTRDRWLQHLQLTTQQASVTELTGATMQRWQSADGRTELVIITTASGGHSWPHSKPVRGKTPSTAIDANEVIWQFFARQP